MRTEDDLRSVFAGLDGDADPGDLLARARTGAVRRRRTRVVTAVAGATAAAVAAVAIPTALFHSASGPVPNPAGPTPAAELDVLALPYAFDAPAGYTLLPKTSNLRMQVAEIEADGQVAAQLNVYAPGWFDPAEVRRGEAIDLGAGRTSWYGEITSPDLRSAADPAQLAPARVHAVAWELRPGFWALLETAADGSTDAELLRIARAVRPGATPFTVPFRLSGLPAGWTASQLMVTDGVDNPGNWRFEVTLTDGAPYEDRAGTRLGLISSGLRAVASVSLLSLPGLPAPAAPNAVVRGRQAHLDAADHMIYVRYPTSELQAVGADPQRLAEAAALVPAPADLTTWIDARTALPGPAASTPDPAPAVGNGLAYDFTVGPVPGYTVEQSTVGADRQLMQVGTDGQPVATITLYAAGRFDPAEAKRGEQVTVNGTPGWYASIVAPDAKADTAEPGDGTVREPAVVWELLPGRWAVVQGIWTIGYDTKAEELKLAAAVRAGTGPVLLPYRLGALPAGLAPVELSVGDNGGWINTLSLRAPGSAAFVTVTAYQGTPPGPLNTTVGGYPADLVGHDLRIQPGGLTFVISDPDGVLTEAQLRALGEQVAYAADPLDRGTWFDARTVSS